MQLFGPVKLIVTSSTSTVLIYALSLSEGVQHIVVWLSTFTLNWLDFNWPTISHLNLYCNQDLKLTALFEFSFPTLATLRFLNDYHKPLVQIRCEVFI